MWNGEGGSCCNSRKIVLGESNSMAIIISRHSQTKATRLSIENDIDCASAAGKQACPVSGLFSYRAVRPLEFDLAIDEKDRVSLWGKLLPPRRASPIWHERDAVPVVDEFPQPFDLSVLVPIRRVHPDEPAPFTIKRAACDKRTARYVTRASRWCRHVHIENAAKSIEDVFRSIPLIALASALPAPLAHAASLSGMPG